MTSVSSAAEAVTSPMQASLSDGIDQLDRDEELEFKRYKRLILPLDGFVFWVLSSILTDPPALTTLKAKGAVHRTASNRQDEDQTQTANHLIFTTTTRIDDFNAVDSDEMWICIIDGAPFAFSSMRERFEAAGLYHYRGDSISPIIRAQMIDSPDALNNHELVVSNSLPILMKLSQFCPVYPAYLVPSNLAPPYAVVDVRGSSAMQEAPIVMGGERWQLMKDDVRVTLTGMNNSGALNYRDYIVDEAAENEQFGVQNIPYVTDLKVIQSEINALAMKKYIDFDINYYQQTAREVSRQLILEAVAHYEVFDES